MVRVRLIAETKAIPLCEVPWCELEPLRREVARWGLHSEDDTETTITGQFVVENGEAFFELIAGDD